MGDTLLMCSQDRENRIEWPKKLWRCEFGDIIKLRTPWENERIFAWDQKVVSFSPLWQSKVLVQ
jgi:hypothetical protein